MNKHVHPIMQQALKPFEPPVSNDNNSLNCYSCGEEIKTDKDGTPECYCNYCLPENNPLVLTKKGKIFIKCGNYTYRIKQLNKEEGNSNEGDGLDVFLYEAGGDND